MYDAKEINQHFRSTWEDYTTILNKILDHGHRRAFDVWSQPYADFLTSGIVLGDIPQEMAEKTINALERCPHESFDVESVHPQFFFTIEKQNDKEDLIAMGTTFFRLSAEARWLISDINDHVCGIVSSCIGAPWRVLGTRAWSLTSESISGVGACGWHNDALPLGIYKVMYYLTPLDDGHGTLEVRLADGEEVALEREGPAWVFFKPSELIHRGVPPKSVNAKRYAIETSLISSVAYDTSAFFAGHNARHPFYPWQRACYDGL